MKPRSRHNQPRFVWQAFLIVLPVVMLTSLSILSLRRDEQTAEREARAKAAQNIQSLARAVRALVAEEFHHFLALQDEWVSALRFPPSKLKPDIIQWEQTHPGLALADLATPEIHFSAERRQIEPPDDPLVPVPPQWFRELSPEQRDLWEALRNATNARAIYQKFLNANPSDTAAQAAWLLTQSPEAVLKQPALPSESGVSFQDLACYRLLAESSAPLSESLLNAVARQVTEHPSLLSAKLLDLTEELTNRADAPTRDQVRRLRLLWRVRSRAQDWIDALREHSDLGQLRCVWTRDGEALAFVSPATESGESEGYIVRFIPRPVVQGILVRALNENRFFIPDYAVVVAIVEGMPLHVGDGPATMKQKPVLGSADENLDGANLELNFHLANRQQMLAAEQRRAKLFGGLIVATALAALTGLAAAWRAFRQQLRLNDLKSNFVSSVSHELRAPIASVRLMAEGLERGKIQEPARQHEYFRFISQECRRLSALIENVLDFSRIEQGRKLYEFEPTDLVALVRETVRLMESYAAEKQVRLDLNLDNSEPGIGNLEPTMDGRSIQQALVNLIDNAIKHSPQDETVTVGLEQTVAAARLWVEDRGPGIPAKEHNRIFERFYRLGSELRRETQGVGIGLSIVKHIVEAHGGAVQVRSAVGQGSRFTIELPVRQPGTGNPEP